MLILVRKIQQAIWIEGDIYVKVLSVERDRVKLGITAPDDVKVMRQELFSASAGADAPTPRRRLGAAASERGKPS